MLSGVDTEKIGKGRILADLRDICKVFVEILPLQKSKDKPRKTKNINNNKTCFSLRSNFNSREFDCRDFFVFWS